MEAQEAIERVYYAQQIGATKPFEEAIPRVVLEREVRQYLAQTVALEVYWNTPVTDEMLERELERMARGTRLPGRLLELYSALGDDPFLIQECLARAIVVDRLTRHFCAFDPALQVEARAAADELHGRLAAGDLSVLTEHPNRSVVETETSDATSATPFRYRLSPAEFQKVRARLPGGPGQVSPVEETPDAFVLDVILSETARDLRVANYVFPKVTWDAWWETAQRRLQRETVVAVASDRAALPVPNGGRSFDAAAACAADDTWDNGILDDLPEARIAHAAVWTGNEMVVWGGETTSSFLDTGGRYDPFTDTWAATSTLGAPSARSDARAVWTGNQMLVWGGGGDGGRSIIGGRYDPAADTWAPTSTQGAPVGRLAHTAIWTGSMMVIWGGGNDTSTGGRYCAAACPAPLTWYQDHDGDGSGTTSVEQLACTQPMGFASIAGDCNDLDPAIYPGGPEINDGNDNQCPGDPGYGMIDEISGTAAFAADKTVVSWPAQPVATAYEVARSTNPDFSAACTAFYTVVPSITDTDEPESGATFFYIVRATAPFTGSWGQTSAGAERSTTCP